MGLTLLVVLYLATVQNVSFLKAVYASLPQPFGWEEWRLMATVFCALLTLLFLALLPFAQRRTLKPALVVFLVVASVCSYFMDSFGIVIDRSMLVNVANTDAREAGDLLRSAFLVHVLLKGILPSLVIAYWPTSYESTLRSIGRRLGAGVLVLASLIALVYVQYNDVAMWARQQRDVRLYVNPTFPLYSAYRHVKDAMPSGPKAPLVPLAPDAIQKAPTSDRPLLVVLVLGETARAANFQLNGYSRQTNPRLSQLKDLINFPTVSSCGTFTAESVPCIFSGLGKGNFDRGKATERENALDVFKRVGINVTWRNNNSGCQRVCNRIGMDSMNAQQTPDLCTGGECLDGILLKNLEQVYPAEQGTSFLVLHQKGSHGPAYFKRYPEAARVFVPDCRNENVQQCSRQEVVNSYDNSLVYTDEVLASLIEELRKQQDRLDSVMLYVSDHGESLGENGIYLHGLPYRLAPAEQTKVPMMAWFSSNAPESLKLDMDCVRGVAGKSYSHDNLFPSLLGLLRIQTSAYDEKLDMFGSCRRV